MKQPTIMYEGVECKVTGIYWDSKGEVAHVVFSDHDGESHTAFQADYFDTVGYKNGLLHLELKDHLKL